MLSKVSAAGLYGTEGFIVCVEADVSDGLPGITMIGYLASAVREAQDRVCTAIRNSGIHYESRKLTINLSPASVRKDGCGFDVAIALAILRSYGYIGGEFCMSTLRNSVFIGELGLDGRIKEVNGVISLVDAARKEGYSNVFLPRENAIEGSVISDINCYAVDDLNMLIDILNGSRELPDRATYVEPDEDFYTERDFSDVCGQEMIKRATLLAVGGRHNILFIGPAGTGKSMIASRIPGIMPLMTMEERIEVSKLYSASGLLTSEEPLIRHRPFRSPHHTISPIALAGGGTVPKPGEISLASGGVLFLDELAEFKSNTIEVLRQPMETKEVNISRLYGSIKFPADFVLCAATNPCKCGFYPDRTKCSCTELQVKNYLSRISKPILDRIDICVETAIPEYKDMKSHTSVRQTEEFRKRIENVQLIQRERLKPFGMRFNSEMNESQIALFCDLHEEDELFLQQYYEQKGLSARGLHKVLKVARTIADFDESVNITHEHLCEAISYRNLAEKYWGGGHYDGYRQKIHAVPSESRR